MQISGGYAPKWEIDERDAIIPNIGLYSAFTSLDGGVADFGGEIALLFESQGWATFMAKYLQGFASKRQEVSLGLGINLSRD